MSRLAGFCFVERTKDGPVHPGKLFSHSRSQKNQEEEEVDRREMGVWGGKVDYDRGVDSGSLNVGESLHHSLGF